MPDRKPGSNRSTSRNAAARTPGPPILLNGLLKAVVADLGVEQKLTECRAVMVWEEAVGAALAEHTRPLRVRRGLLEVAVPSGIWRTQLSFMQLDIVARINELLGAEVVKHLKLLNQTERS